MDSNKKQIFEKVKDKINQKYNIEIMDENNNKEEEPVENMLVIDIKEKIKNEEKKKDSNDTVINSDLLNIIHDRNKKKGNKNIFFLTSFKLEEMEYIWKGDYNKENKKNGRGKEYDFDDNIVFEG